MRCSSSSKFPRNCAMSSVERCICSPMSAPLCLAHCSVRSKFLETRSWFSFTPRLSASFSRVSCCTRSSSKFPLSAGKKQPTRNKTTKTQKTKRILMAHSQSTTSQFATNIKPQTSVDSPKPKSAWGPASLCESTQKHLQHPLPLL